MINPLNKSRPFLSIRLRNIGVHLKLDDDYIKVIVSALAVIADILLLF